MKGLSSSEGLRKGSWDEDEDQLLRECIEKNGEGKWGEVPLSAGLNRCRKSCRLRWLNYLRPNIKRGEFEPDEVDLIARMHKLLGNRWSLIAGRVPGRTANDIKNFYNTRLKKRCSSERRHPPPRNTDDDNHMTEVLKPQPQTLSQKSHQWIINKASAAMMNNNSNNQHDEDSLNNVSSSDDYLDDVLWRLLEENQDI